MEKKLFEELYSIDVNDKIEKKNGLSYLSWAWAWAEFVKRCPDARYEIKAFDGKPYLYDEKLGYMVFTSITVGDDTKEMWLPVMDASNKSMKDHPYKYVVKTKDGNKYEKTCEAASMFDINKSIMRCLVKNISMFGLGLYIYIGEDLPEQIASDDAVIDIPKTNATKKSRPTTKEDLCIAIEKLYKESEIIKMLNYYKKTSLSELEIDVLNKYYDDRCQNQ